MIRHGHHDFATPLLGRRPAPGGGMLRHGRPATRSAFETEPAFQVVECPSPASHDSL
ncbi:hypothetical protein HNR61_005009 [Actinomadura namibiensis]|uniref:Uncharacterized protein n=1 Tax=Actinomadura namibiensis TaxID=182080 RepID=A0A7W3LS82_ACTNM|nr:hypothetical protein [Actinomadura namibiensis]